MKRLFTLLALLMMSTGMWAQCYTIDTSSVYWVWQKNAYAIAISNSGKIAVSSARTDSAGKKGVIKIWNDVSDFTAGFHWDDTLIATSPKGLAWDNSNRLYVVQTELSDSNILMYDASLHIIAAVGNSPGTGLEWNDPRGIAVDEAGSLYVVSGDSLDHADMLTTLPGTGKLFKITGLPGTATKQTLLTGLHSPKSVSIDGDRLLISENASNKVRIFNKTTLAALDSLSTDAPMDVKISGCRAFSSNAVIPGIKIMNANNLSDTAIANTIGNIGTSVGKFGIDLNYDRDLLLCDNDSGRVIFYRGNIVYDGTSGGPCNCAVFCVGSDHTFSTIGSGSWFSDDPTIVTITPGGVAHGENVGYTTVRYVVDTTETVYTVTIQGPMTGSLTVTTNNSDGTLASDSVKVCIKRNRKFYATGGEYWYSTDPSIAAVSRSGVVWPKSEGQCSIVRVASNSCNSISGSITVKVINPYVAKITGDSLVCISSTASYADVTPGGYWFSRDTTVATVDSTSGAITPVRPGDADIVYMLDRTCEEGSASRSIHVDSHNVAGVIEGDDTVCLSTPIDFNNPTGTINGKWTVADTSMALIDSSSGYLTPHTAGTVTISYSLHNACGDEHTAKDITILAEPDIQNFWGPLHICQGISDSLHQDDTAGTLTWLSSDVSIASVTDYSVSGVGYGDAILTVRSSNYCASDSATWSIHVDSNLVVPVIAGSDSVCIDVTFALSVTEGPTTGKWYSNAPSIAVVDSVTGAITGVSEGLCEISYRVEGPCDTLTAQKEVYIKGVPNPAPLSGVANVCPLAHITLSSPGYSGAGTWLSSNPAAAVVSAGVVTGVAAGTTTITFTAINECGDTSITTTITVDSSANAGTISGPASVCDDATVLLTVAGNTGTLSWSSANASIATVADGTVGGVTAGSTTITVTATNVCGTATATKAITVTPLPVAGTIAGPASGCQYTSATYTVSGTIGTITWSSSDAGIFSISSTGTASFHLDGVADVIATATNVCGTTTATRTVTVNPAPVAAAIAAPASGCEGSADYVDAPGSVGDGYWYSSDPSVVDFDWTYMETAGIGYHSAGTATIYYHVSNSCGDAESYADITVLPLPVAGTIVGPDSMCFGASISLIDYGASDPGSWSSSNPSIATVSATGMVTGTSTTIASATIYYSVSNFCGTADATKTVYVKRSPITGTITGPSSVCSGSTISLDGVMPGGTWTTASPGIATVTAAGVVGGVLLASGTSTTISYIVNTFSCGSAVASTVVSVNPLPNRGFITGADTVCMLSYDTVRNHSATPGGTWRSRQGKVAFVTSPVGIDTIAFQGIIAGTDTLVYTVSNACGSDSALFSIRVNAYPLDGEVVGPTSVCTGSSMILSDPTGTPGGTWTTSDPAIATVNPISGLVTGLSAGPVVITYVGSTGCGFIPDPYNIVVNPAPNAVIAPAPSSVCAGNTVTLDNTGSFGIGTWISSNPAVATVDIANGIVGGVAAGTTTITYITLSSFCGLDTAYHIMTVNPLPVAGTITGPDSVCAGSSISLVDAAPGGTWSSSAPGIAAVTTGGLVTGGSVSLVSMATISYTVPSAFCGSAAATHAVYVKPLPVAGTISGPASVCMGNTATLTAAIGGGTWSSPSPLVSVNATSGAVSGLNTGTATISYAITNSCGTAYATTTISINTIPAITPITGLDSVCTGTTIVETSSPGGGTWDVRFGYISVVSASGTTATIQGISAGIDTLTYVATNVCGYSTISRPIRVMSVPSAGFIAGSDTMCPGAVATLTNPSGTPGGAWSHPGTILSLSATGVVSALFPGTDTVLYTVSNYCGTSVAAHRIYIHPLPVAGTITGPAGVCAGASVTLTNATGTPGGIWASGSGGTITSAGVFTGVTPGPVTVSYQASTACGTLFAYYTIIVNPLPTVAAISGPTAICAGTNVTFTDATSGGFWSVSPTTIATITSLGGALHAITPGGATVSYAVTNLCGTTTVTLPITVNTVPYVAALLGTPTVCMGSTTTLYAGTPGGVWSASNSYATVAGGVVTGVSGGTDTITYTVTNSCGSTSVTRIVTVLPAAGTDTIAGPSLVCTGQVTTLTILSPGGTWSASNGNATVTGGAVTGVFAGVDTIYYSVTNTCGTTIASRVVTVNTSVEPLVTASVAPDDTVCGTAPATFTATPVNGGAAPYLEWHNATSVIGTGTPLSYGPTDGETIWCTMAGNAVCALLDTVNSNVLTMHQYPFIVPTVTITASADTLVYMGESITFSAATASCGSSTYQWYINGSAIAGATSATYTATVAGADAYYCIATCDTPCAVAVYNHSNVITLHTGMADVQNTQGNTATIIVAPNPNNGTFIISAGNLQDDILNYQVVNVLGQVIQTGNIPVRNNTVHHSISLPDVASGQYLLKIISGGNSKTFQVEVLR